MNMNDLTRWKMQLVINEANGIVLRSLEGRIKRLECMVENLADDVFGDNETPSGMGLTTGSNGKRFKI